MKKTLLFNIGALCFILVFHLAKAQYAPPAKWTVKNPLEQKVFIENKGQYTLQGKVQLKDILFGSHQDGLDYYFTPTGIWIKSYVAVKRSDAEIKKLSLSPLCTDKVFSDKNSNAINYTYLSELHQIAFIGSNPLVEIEGDNGIKQYCNYTLPENINIRAKAFKKITYLNLYPGIDMEFYFPENKQGFEYSFIIHPGADVSQIKMQYPFNKKIQLTKDGNISIESGFGEFIDHSPEATQQGTLKKIKCSFTLQNGIVQFALSNYNKTQNLIIDPWTTVPKLTTGGGNRVYDLDWDNAGNCYVYGGEGVNYYQLLKFDSTGNLVWSYTKIPTSGVILLGDFAVDHISQSVYIVEGFDYYGPGAQVLKINASGMAIDSVTPSPNMQVMFRVSLSRKYNKLVIAGGSTTTPDYTAMTIDTSLLNANPIAILNPANSYHYVWGLTLDDFGNCYMATARYFNEVTNNNTLFKLPLPTLAPAAWSVYDHYNFNGVSNVRYVLYSGGNGYNGMVVSNNDTSLYTYDSYTLKRWNTTTGNVVDSASVNIDTNTVNLFINWGGISADDCNDIFLGSTDTIKRYDGNLNLVNTIPAADTIYDIKLGKDNILYVCGLNFVSAYQLTPRLTTSGQYKVCTGSSISLKASGADSYTWSPAIGLNSTTGDSVMANPSINTTYTIIGIGTLACPDTIKTVVIVDSLPHVIISNSISSICSGQSFSLLANGATNYVWTPSAGLNMTTGDSVLAAITLSTSYKVVGIDSNGCRASASDSITVIAIPNKPTITISITGDSLISSATQGNQWYLNDTIIPGATNQIYIVKGHGEGKYTVNIVNPANGCSATSDSIVITGVSQMSINNNQLLIYPNPFNNEIIVQINLSVQDVKNWTMEITDVLGRIIDTKPSLSYSNAIDFSGLASGIYFITINNPVSRKVYPVVKQE